MQHGLVEGHEPLVVEQERFGTAAGLLTRLEEIRSTTRLFLELHVAPDAPAWVGVAVGTTTTSGYQNPA